ncbi:MAG: sensor histidine kinase [Bacteroidota bacterium]
MNQNFSYKIFLIIYVMWWLGWIILQTLALRYATVSLPWRMALEDAAVSNVILALAGYMKISALRYYRPRLAYQVIWGALFAVGAVMAFRWIMIQLEPDQSLYMDFLEDSLVVRALFASLMMAFIIAFTWLWSYVREQQETDNRKADTEKLAREAELSKLRQQLQPHFLFNSLNSISALAGTRPDEARKMIQQLSDFLRGTLKKDEQQLVSLSEELEHLQLYLDIEKVRFGHRLKTVTQKDEASLNMQLPSLLLQPVVENAIKFGLYDTVGEITISISARAEDHQLVVAVENLFDPSTSQPRQGTGFGLNSVQRRLYLLYARQDLLSTEQLDNTFITRIKIPQLV